MTDELLIRFLLKETSEEESISVQSWIDATTSNKKHFTAFEKIWNASKNLSTQSTIDEKDAWQRFKQKTDAHQQQVPQKLKPTYNWIKVAAVLFLIAAGWSVYTILSPVSYINVSTGNTVTTKFLPDGSELTLNKNAKISYANNFKRNRKLRLQEGNVFFDVVPDKSRPFVIDIDKISVLVVGTSFNIKHLHEQTEIIVESGIVKVSIGQEELNLQKGEKVTISKTSDKLIKTQNTDQLYNYYRSKEFVTNNTPLWRLIEVLNEEYGSNIVITDEAVKTLTLNTTLKTTNSLDANLELICKTNGLILTRNQNQIILSNHQ